MPDQDQSIPFDLSRYTESTRRAVYDRVVSLLWTPTDDPEDRAPGFTPDDAHLVVFFSFGRWFVVWTNRDEPDAPEDIRIEVARIQAAPDSRFGVVLMEV